MRTIMVATDLSVRSDRALRRATLLARQHGARIMLLHVVEESLPASQQAENRDKARHLLDRTAETMHAVDTVLTEVRVVVGTPFSAIVEEVEQHKPDLLVMGPCDTQALKTVFVGTTAERVLRSVSCPVLMAKGVPAQAYRHVMQTTDLSDGAQSALKLFAGLRFADTAHQTVLHVFDALSVRRVGLYAPSQAEVDFNLSRESAAARQALADAMAQAGAGRPELLVRNLETTAAQDILTIAEEIGADLLVISTRGRSGLAKLMLGSVAEQVLKIANIDVLAVPPAAA